jgi:hypothetical protein
MRRETQKRTRRTPRTSGMVLLPGVVVAAMMLAGCDEMLGTKRTVDGRGSANAGPGFRANAVKYSDQARPATGRSGAASLEALATLDAQGSIELLLTAGALEVRISRAAP